jgi:hypothetical protein
MELDPVYLNHGHRMNFGLRIFLKPHAVCYYLM